MATLDYCEFRDSLYKYRLSGVDPDCFNELLNEHLSKNINLCVYFHKEKNNLFALNLDSTSMWQNKIKVAALYMAENLMELGFTPLIIKSGHGYHFWCRISAPVANVKLQDLMAVLMDTTINRMKAIGLENSDLRCTCYPRQKASDVSLRLFGSEHKKTGLFSFVVTQINTEDTMLDEEASWSYFESYMKECTISKELFDTAYEKAAKSLKHARGSISC
jgi:hypothetical protein